MTTLWLWVEGAKKRYIERLRFRGELLSAVLRTSGVYLSPEELYPTKHESLEERLERLTRDSHGPGGQGGQGGLTQVNSYAGNYR